MKTSIKEQNSWYQQYADTKGSIGQIAHYINVICGLRYAENAKIGDGVVTCHGKRLATYTYDENDEPIFEFVEEWMNKNQTRLLNGEE